MTDLDLGGETMFNVYVPDPIYERLPRIYLLLAAALALVPLSQIKWVAVAALILAMTVTLHQRQIYRETSRRRSALKLRQDLTYEPPQAVGDVQLTKTWRCQDPRSSASSRDPAEPAGHAAAEKAREKTDLYRTVLVPRPGE